jgi:hypothetical protein
MHPISEEEHKEKGKGSIYKKKSRCVVQRRKETSKEGKSQK